jgi:hypothetical protein
VRRQAWWLRIRLEQKYLAAFEVIDEFFVLGRAHIAGPNNLGTVNIRPIVNPFTKGIVVRPVPHDDKLAPWKPLERRL